MLPLQDWLQLFAESLIHTIIFGTNLTRATHLQKRATIGSVQSCWFNASPPPCRCKIHINQSMIHGYSFVVSGADKKKGKQLQLL